MVVVEPDHACGCDQQGCACCRAHDAPRACRLGEKHESGRDGDHMDRMPTGIGEIVVELSAPQWLQQPGVGRDGQLRHDEHRDRTASVAAVCEPSARQKQQRQQDICVAGYDERRGEARSSVEHPTDRIGERAIQCRRSAVRGEGGRQCGRAEGRRSSDTDPDGRRRRYPWADRSNCEHGSTIALDVVSARRHP